METLVEPPQIEYRLVDDIPEVAEHRQAVREHAESILETNRARAEADESLELIPVDALSTGRSVLEAKQTHGFNSLEYEERWAGLVQDCDRYVREWYRKLRPEYFEPVRHTFNEKEQAFYSHGLSVQQMTENALVPIAGDSEEEDRRVNEHVEDRTPQIVRNAGAIVVGREVIRTISECTDTAIESYESDMEAGKKHRGYRGYVPEIKKLMVRDLIPDTESNDRFEEQVGLPGVYITHEIIQMALQRRKLNVAHMDKTELHGAQFIAGDDLMMGFVALLDEVAREQWCNENIFMGEEVEPDHTKDYSKFREEALERQRSLKGLAETTATFILDVAGDPEFDSRKGPAHVEEFVKIQLLDLGKKDRKVAAQMFDEKTADKLQEVVRLEKRGKYEEAYELMEEVRKSAPGGGACGAGSCGLEAIGAAEEKILREKLKATDKDKLVRDKERKCKCGGSVVYAYSDSKVSKLCEKCDKSETTYTKSGE